MQFSYPCMNLNIGVLCCLVWMRLITRGKQSLQVYLVPVGACYISNLYQGSHHLFQFYLLLNTYPIIISVVGFQLEYFNNVWTSSEEKKRRHCSVNYIKKGFIENVREVYQREKYFKHYCLLEIEKHVQRDKAFLNAMEKMYDEKGINLKKYYFCC